MTSLPIRWHVRSIFDSSWSMSLAHSFSTSFGDLFRANTATPAMRSILQNSCPPLTCLQIAFSASSTVKKVTPPLREVSNPTESLLWRGQYENNISP